MTATREQTLLAGQLIQLIRTLLNALAAHRIEGMAPRLIFVVKEDEWQALVANTLTAYRDTQDPKKIDTMTVLGVEVMRTPLAVMKVPLGSNVN